MLRTVGEAPDPVAKGKDNAVVELPNVRCSEDVWSVSLGREVMVVVVGSLGGWGGAGGAVQAMVEGMYVLDGGWCEVSADEEEG